MRYTYRMAAPQLSDRLLTAEEFFELSDPPGGGKLELICGKVVRHMPVNGQHGETVVMLIEQLGPFIRKNALGKLLVEVGHLISRGPDVVLAPDASFVSNESMPATGFPKHGFLPFVPTLAIEVVSPGDLDSEVAEKVDRYLAAGVERVWVVRPQQLTISVFRGATSRLIGAGGTLTSDDAGFAVEGFELPVADLFS